MFIVPESLMSWAPIIVTGVGASYALPTARREPVTTTVSVVSAYAAHWRTERYARRDQSRAADQAHATAQLSGHEHAEALPLTC